MIILLPLMHAGFRSMRTHYSSTHRYRFIIGAAILSSIFLFLGCTIFWRSDNSDHRAFGLPFGSTQRRLPRDVAANSTLGVCEATNTSAPVSSLIQSEQFEKILAVSRGPSWRTRGLRAAAELTKLDITLLTQPYISPDVASFFEKNGKGSTTMPVKYGSALAWLVHLDILKLVVMSGISTALIVEDDVDWDIEVGSQMQKWFVQST
jgi:hypothetical protein